mgnify:CR=1 FL=1
MLPTAYVLVMILAKGNGIVLQYTVSGVMSYPVCERAKEANMADPFRHPDQTFVCKRPQ